LYAFILQGKNIIVFPIPQGDYKKPQGKNIKSKPKPKPTVNCKKFLQLTAGLGLGLLFQQLLCVFCCTQYSTEQF